MGKRMSYRSLAMPYTSLSTDITKLTKRRWNIPESSAPISGQPSSAEAVRLTQ
jgi:hypothetical protein